MKKSLLSLASIALALTAAASTAHADLTPNDLFRFDISCSFGSVGCSAESRIIFNADRTVEIDLKDHPFDGHNKTVNASLEIRHERSSGTCTIVAKDLHGLDAAGATSSTLN
jgi:hypothetical protein